LRSWACFIKRHADREKSQDGKQPSTTNKQTAEEEESSKETKFQTGGRRISWDGVLIGLGISLELDIVGCWKVFSFGFPLSKLMQQGFGCELCRANLGGEFNSRRINFFAL